LFINRVYLGAGHGAFNEPVEKYPEAIRHVWQGLFEKHEVFLHVGIYLKNGKRYIGELAFD